MCSTVCPRATSSRPFSGSRATAFEVGSQEDLIYDLREQLKKPEYADAVVLIKGSRSSRMDCVVDALLKNTEELENIQKTFSENRLPGV